MSSRKRGAKKLSKKNLLPVLHALKSIKPAHHRKTIINSLDEPTCQSLYELVHNVLSSKRISPAQVKKLQKSLSPHKEDLRYIARLRGKNSVKRKKLSSMGAFPFTALLSAAIPLLTSLLFRKKNQ